MTRYWPTSEHIRVKHGRMTLWFPSGTTQAAIDKRLKAIDAATKQAQKIVANPRSTWPKLPKPTRCKVPSVEMMEAAGTVVPEHGYTDRHTKNVAKWSAPGQPLVVMPLDMLKAGLLAAAHRTLKKWPAENPPQYEKWCRYRDEQLPSLPTEHIEKVVASILRPGGRVASGAYAASLVWGLEELERRAQEVVA